MADESVRRCRRDELLPVLGAGDDERLRPPAKTGGFISAALSPVRKPGEPIGEVV